MENYKIPNRLQDLLSLITVLAQHQSTYRSITGIQTDLQRNPLSASSWLDVVRDHPEFFRYDARIGKKHNISLLIRHQKQQAGTGQASMLSLEETKLILDTAILIDEKQNSETSNEASSVRKADEKSKENVFLKWTAMASKNEIEEVMQSIQEFALQRGDRNTSKTITQLSSRWYNLKEDNMKGLVNDENYRLNSDKIRNSLIEVVYDLNDKYS